MKGKIAKIGGRTRGNTEVTEENVSIEYLKLTVTNADTGLDMITLFRMNHGIVEAVSENAADLLGMSRVELEAHISNENLPDAQLKSLIGVNRLRFSMPSLDAKLVHKISEGE